MGTEYRLLGIGLTSGFRALRRSRRRTLVAFDQGSAFEPGSGAHEGDQVGCVDRAPTLLGGL
jgi:hypothetical protein